jgi:hypothetical protein
LSATGGGHSIRRKGAAKNVATKIPGSAEPAGPSIEAQHHRHWQGVLRRVAGLEIATLPTPLPMTGTILGGTMELHGGHISLACFHGVNFKSKSWALFSLKDPCVSFATEAQEIPGDGMLNFWIFSDYNCTYLRLLFLKLFLICSRSQGYSCRSEPVL